MNGMRAYTAEFIGTFILCFIGAGSICADSLSGGHVGLVGVALVGRDAALRAGERDGGRAAILKRQRQERHRDALARGEQHVELALIGLGGDLARQVDELIGVLAHGADHDDQMMAGATRRQHALGHRLDALDGAHRRATILVNENRHAAAIAHAREGVNAKARCAASSP